MGGVGTLNWLPASGASNYHEGEIGNYSRNSCDIVASLFQLTGLVCQMSVSHFCANTIHVIKNLKT